MHKAFVLFAAFLLSDAFSVSGYTGFSGTPGQVQTAGSPMLAAEIDRRATATERKATAWGRDLHEHPELRRS